MRNPLSVIRSRSAANPVASSPLSAWSTPTLSALPLAARIQRDMDRIFNDFFGADFGLSAGLSSAYPSGLTTNFPSLLGERETGWMAPACDIQDLEHEYAISMDVPGMKKEDLHIEIRDHQILVSGERKAEQEKVQADYEMKERFYGKFERAFDLPASVDEDSIEANYEDGVLMINIPKTVEAKSTTKQVKIAESARSSKSAKSA